MLMLTTDKHKASRDLSATAELLVFKQPGVKSEWCIGLLLWCLAAQTVSAKHLSSCWWLLLSSAPRERKSTELLWNKTPDFTPDVQPPNRPDLNPVDYGIAWTVIQECIYQKQQGSSYITVKLWLLTEWHIIFHNVGYRNTHHERWAILLQFCCKFISVSVCQKLSKYNAVWQSYCKNRRVQFLASQCIPRPACIGKVQPDNSVQSQSSEDASSYIDAYEYTLNKFASTIWTGWLL